MCRRHPTLASTSFLVCLGAAVVYGARFGLAPNLGVGIAQFGSGSFMPTLIVSRLPDAL